ncbi:MAG: hypothetical protein WC325_11865 [Candidatus Bathyarchaeia archaeon]|jgi:hypothetical protein
MSQVGKATNQLVLASIIAFTSFLLLYASLFYMWAYSMWFNRWDFMFGAVGFAASTFFAVYFSFVVYALVNKYLFAKKTLRTL